MQEFLNYFEHLPIWIKGGWVLFFITFFWIIEGYYTFYKNPGSKWKHAKTNFILLVLVLIINSLFGVALTLVDGWLASSGIGVLNMFETPLWVKLIISILVLDFTSQYLVHFLLHKVRWMWRLHIVHHTDQHVDVTTGTRHHPLDFLIRETFALGVVILMGMPISFYFLYRMITIPFTYFNHANISLPLWLDKGLSYVIVSPNMHKFHHHYELPWTDSNYGNVLSIWDRIFGTFTYDDPSKIVYGLDSANHTDDEDVMVQLKIPFSKEVKSIEE
jgi:sterol desaturase/sphingolipid hydroxylase (fatty acid hydroxylase superfamily)